MGITAATSGIMGAWWGNTLWIRLYHFGNLRLGKAFFFLCNANTHRLVGQRAIHKNHFALVPDNPLPTAAPP